MPIKDEYLSWLNDVPEEHRGKVRESFEGSVASKKLQELEGALSEVQMWSRPRAKMLARLDEYGEFFEHSPDDLRKALANKAPAQEEMVERAENIKAMMASGEVDWDLGQKALKEMAGEYTRMSQTTSRMSKFMDEEVPTFTKNLETQFTNMRTQVSTSLGNTLDFNAELIEYSRKHPDRDPRKIVQVVKTNPNLKSFDEAVSEAFHDDELRTQVRQEFEKKTTPAQRDESGEVSGLGVSSIFRRGRTQERIQAVQSGRKMNDADVREKVMALLTSEEAA